MYQLYALDVSEGVCVYDMGISLSANMVIWFDVIQHFHVVLFISFIQVVTNHKSEGITV